MEPTLKESIAAIFGTEARPTEPVVEPPPMEEPEEPMTAEIASLIKEAQQHYDKAQQYLKTGDWAGYGEELDALKAVLQQLAELAAIEDQ
jgi:uncharacterized membrane protein (UPF0182 family)